MVVNRQIVNRSWSTLLKGDHAHSDLIFPFKAITSGVFNPSIFVPKMISLVKNFLSIVLSIFDRSYYYPYLRILIIMHNFQHSLFSNNAQLVYNAKLAKI